MSLSRRASVTAALITLVSAAGAAASQTPVTVSPGTAAGARIGDPCPTFSWGAVEEALSYELVVYRLLEDGEEPEPVLRQPVPGSASSWTPSIDRCLERGGRYAWSVRAAGEKTPPGWSAPALFQVAAAPDLREFEHALEVVQEYLSAQQPTEVARTAPAAAGTRPVAAPSGVAADQGRPRSASTSASAAARAPASRSAALLLDGAIGAGQGWGAFVTSPSEPLADLHVVGDTLFADMLLAPADLGLVGGDSEIMLAAYAHGSHGMKIRYDWGSDGLEIWGYEEGVHLGPWLTIDRVTGEATFSGKIFRHKQNIETVTSSTTLQADDHLFFDIGANELWAFEALLWVETSTATGDLELVWRGPDNSDVRSNVVAYQGNTIIEQENQLSMDTAVSVDYPATAAIEPIYLKGLFWGGDGGTISLEWAQSAASGTTKIFFPSYLEARRVKIGSFYP